MRKNEKKSIFSKPPQFPILSSWILNLHIIICRDKKSTVTNLISLRVHVPATSVKYSGSGFPLLKMRLQRLLWKTVVSCWLKEPVSNLVDGVDGVGGVMNTRPLRK